MRIISFNINRYNRSKLDYVLEMGADIYVLPECGSREVVGEVPGYRMEWMGEYEWKGLGVLIRDGIRYEVPEWFNDDHKYLIPIVVDDDFVLLASWPTRLKERHETYPQILLEGLKDYEPHLRGRRCLVCGDFNCYVGQGSVSRRTGLFEDCIAFMGDMGLHDIYHSLTGEQFSRESRHTYHHQFKPDMPFFIDYAFTNMVSKRYEIADWNPAVSDHSCVTIEI